MEVGRKRDENGRFTINANKHASDSCHNEHPGARTSYEQPQTNRFASLSNQGGSGGGALDSRTRANATSMSISSHNHFFKFSDDMIGTVGYRMSWGEIRTKITEKKRTDKAVPVVEEHPYYLVSEDIRCDLTYRRDNEKGERPLYPLGAYGPGKGAPKQLIEGDLEQSPEELRVQAYLALANGLLPQFVSLVIRAPT